ncbi:hypothetical protein F5887DRAFT_982351 [Amanita rubescens]|nr:hypothetical protein F5887DRAFT_982351 [Amanita rubescens]
MVSIKIQRPYSEPPRSKALRRVYKRAVASCASQITPEMPQSSRTQWVGIAALSAIILLLGLLYVSFRTDISESVRSYLPSTFRIGDDCIIPPFSPNQGSSSCVTTCYNASNTLLLGDGRDPHITKVVTHVHGFTVFENVYVRNGTFFVVHEDSVVGNSSQAEGFPPRRNIITKIVDYGPGVDFEPSDDELTFVRASNASNALGHFARRVKGVTVVMYDPVNFMHHFYHWWGEVILGAWRVYSTINQSNVTHMPFPPTWSETQPMHFLMPFSVNGGWRDHAGVNGPLMRAAFPSASLEESNHWADLKALGSTMVFDRLMIVNRQAAHFHPNGGVWFKMIAGSMSVNATKHFWEPLRGSLVKGLLGYVPTVNNRGAVLSHEEDNGPPLVTYVSRQGGGRRLGQEYHDSLVSSLRELENEGVIRFHVARMELMTIHEQIELAAKTTIMIGVHGNGLTHQLWMPSSPWSTVMEIFRPLAYIFDYEILSRNAGHRHYAVWNDTMVTYPEGTYYGPGLNYGDRFHGDDLPVWGPAVAQTIRERLAERH